MGRLGWKQEVKPNKKDVSRIYTEPFIGRKTRSHEEAQEFFELMVKETVKSLKKYHQNNEEAGFYHGEEQVKTFLTIALNKVTGHKVMQEYPLERKKGLKRKKVIYGHGRLDYLATYNKSDFLIEVKHGWARYYPVKENITFYTKYKYWFLGAINQVRKINAKLSYKIESSDHLFGLSLIVVPFFEKTKLQADVQTIRLTSNFKSKLDEIAKDKNVKANLLAFWALDKDEIEHIEYYDKHKNTFWENYPGVLFLGRIVKFSRTRSK